MVEVVYYPVGSSVTSVFHGRLLRKTEDEYVFRKKIGKEIKMLIVKRENVVSIEEVE